MISQGLPKKCNWLLTIAMVSMYFCNVVFNFIHHHLHRDHHHLFHDLHHDYRHHYCHCHCRHNLCLCDVLLLIFYRFDDMLIWTYQNRSFLLLLICQCQPFVLCVIDQDPIIVKINALLTLTTNQMDSRAEYDLITVKNGLQNLTMSTTSLSITISHSLVKLLRAIANIHISVQKSQNLDTLCNETV